MRKVTPSLHHAATQCLNLRCRNTRICLSHDFVFDTNISISISFPHYWYAYVHGHSTRSTVLGSLKLDISDSVIAHLPGMSLPEDLTFI